MVVGTVTTGLRRMRAVSAQLLARRVHGRGSRARGGPFSGYQVGRRLPRNGSPLVAPVQRFQALRKKRHGVQNNT